MIHDSNADREAQDEWDKTPDRDEWIAEGAHTCTITASYIEHSDYGEQLVLWLRDETGAKGRIKQSFEPDKIKWLKKVMAVLAPEVRTIQGVRDVATSLIGTVVAVKSVQAGHYVNHYINAVVSRPEPGTQPDPVGDDEIPF